MLFSVGPFSAFLFLERKKEKQKAPVKLCKLAFWLNDTAWVILITLVCVTSNMLCLPCIYHYTCMYDSWLSSVTWLRLWHVFVNSLFPYMVVFFQWFIFHLLYFPQFTTEYLYMMYKCLLPDHWSDVNCDRIMTMLGEFTIPIYNVKACSMSHDCFPCLNLLFMQMPFYTCA